MTHLSGRVSSICKKTAKGGGKKPFFLNSLCFAANAHPKPPAKRGVMEYPYWEKAGRGRGAGGLMQPAPRKAFSVKV